MKTKHSIVKESIKSKILNGTYQPNQKISSETELMKEFGVSRHTVRLAIGNLVTQGWLYREQGAGTFCADRSRSEQANKGMSVIAIITTYISDYIFPSIIRGAEAKLSAEGYQVSIFSTNNDYDSEKNILEKILSQNFDGVIIEPTKSAMANPNLNYYLNLEANKIPYIMINAYYDELEPVSIFLNDEHGGYLQTEHLIKQGHQKIIGFFKTDDLQGKNRMKGFIKAHREYNLPMHPNCIIAYDTSERSTKPVKMLERLLESPSEKPTGITCYNDELAMELLDVIRKKGLHVPNDISIVGYDDSFLAEVSEVKLTSVKHPKSELGKLAAEMIIEMIENGDTARKNKSLNTFIFEPELITRDSTKNVGNLSNRIVEKSIDKKEK